MKVTIEASAGTGKTYELTTIVAAALAGPELFPRDRLGSGLVAGPEFAALRAAGALQVPEIVLVTYTEAATRELHGRVRSRLAALRRQLLVPGAEDAGAAALDAASAQRLAGRLGAALADIDSMPISTIHGFCDRIIREHGFELGLGGGRRELLDDGAVAQEIAMRWWSGRVRDDPSMADRCRIAGLDRAAMTALARQAISSRGLPLARAEGSGVEAIAADLMAFAQREIAELAAVRGAGTYQEMLVLVRDALRSSARLGAILRGRHRLGVIDEAQDTDPVQLEIFERLFHFERSDAPRAGAPASGDRLLVLVGDPKQSIYGFRGADLEAYLRLRGSEPPRRLETNRRSEPGAVEAVNRLFGGERPFGRDGIEHPPVRAEASPRHGMLVDGVRPRPAPMELHRGAPGISETEWCVAALRDLMARGLRIQPSVAPGADAAPAAALRWRDMAVLGRSNANLRMLDRRLRAAGIPSILLGDRTVYESEAAEELEALLAACASPGRARLVRRAMISPLVGVDPASLGAAGSEALVQAWARRFEAWAESARRGGALAIVERALAESAAPIDPRMEVDALQLAELLHAAEARGSDAGALRARLERLVGESADLQARPGDPRRRRIDRDDAVTLRTAHTAKGLEYGVVLLPWAGDAIPAPRRGGREGPLRVVRLPARRLGELGPEWAAPAAADPEESAVVALEVDGPGHLLLQQRASEEALRLFYVAVTRARHATLLFDRAKGRRAGASVLDLLDADRRADGRTLRVIEAPTGAGVPPPAPALRAAPPVRGASRRAARVTVRRPLRLWFDTSFTRLSAASDEAGADTEALSEPAALAMRDDEPAPVVTRSRIAGGVLLGRVIHRAFEWASMEGPGADLDSIVREAIAESGGSGRFDPGVLRDLVARTREADLSVVGGPSTTVGAIPPARLACESDFCLPMGHERPFSPARLAEALRRAPVDSPAARFAPIAARLVVGEIQGFLRGTIDLLFEHEGRWWIVDYKSNDLGERDEDYRGASLLEAMLRGRYVLQYLLYAVAARRLLAGRGVPLGDGWFGGAIDPFVRGVDPREPGRGLFIDRPPTGVIEAIDELLRAPAPDGGDDA